MANNLILKFDENLRVEKSLINNLYEYSKSELVVLFPQEEQDIGFEWVTPAGHKYQERSLTRNSEFDENDCVAYTAILYPSFTLGVRENTDITCAHVSVRVGETISPWIKVPVEKTVHPELSELTPTNYTELAARITALENQMIYVMSQVDKI